MADQSHDQGTPFLEKVQFTRNLFFIVLYLFSLPIETFIHHRHGVRYLAWFGFTSITTSFWTLLLFGWWTAARIRTDLSALYVLLLVAFVVTAIARRVQAVSRGGEETPQHSFSCGLSYPIWHRLPVSDWILQGVCEPLAVATLGFLMLAIDGQVASYLMLGAAAIAMKTVMHFFVCRSDRLDLQDSQVEAGYWTEVAQIHNAEPRRRRHRVRRA